ncbi:MAG: SDR family oxidoreductase [Desulfomonilia bacterium]
MSSTIHAVITGAASGLGRDLSIALARKGWRILISDVNTEEAAITLKMVQQAGGTGETYLCDVTSFEQVQTMADYVFGAWGGVDLLVNNAGVAAAGAVGDISIEDWHWLVNINMWGMIYGCHAFIPHMKQAMNGHIINIASAAGIVSLPEMPCYNVSKAAVISLSETLRGELAPYNIGVSVVCPSFFNTNLLMDFRYCDEFQCTFAHTTLENARMTSEEIARKIVKAYEKNRLYVIPHASIKMQWLLKRLSPERYYANMATFNSSTIFRPILLAIARLGLT